MGKGRITGAAALLLSLGGCEVSFNEPDEEVAAANATAPEPAPVPARPAPVQAAPPTAPEEQLPTTANAVSDAPSPLAAGGGEALAPVAGRFAATPALCRGGAWKFEAKRVNTDGETACEVLHREREGSGQRLTLTCEAEGAATNEQWTVTPEDDGGLTVVRRSEGARSSVALVKCG